MREQKPVDVVPADAEDALHTLQRRLHLAELALAVLAVGACGWIVFDLLPALSLVVELLRG